MISQENISNVEIMKDGIRFRRKKRTHNELKNIDLALNQNELENRGIEEKNQSRSKKLKTVQNKENLSYKNKGGTSTILNVNSTNNIVNKSKKIINNDYHYDENPANFNNINFKNNLNKNLAEVAVFKKYYAELPSFKVSENKKVFLKETERVKNILKNFEQFLINKCVPMMANKLINCCKKNSRGIKDLKVASIFKLDKFNVDVNKYSPRTSLINLELFAVDTLFNCKEIFLGLVEVEYPNIGNILLCYYSLLLNLKATKSLIPIIEANIEKHSDVIVIKHRNTENLVNQSKLMTITHFHKFYKNAYLRTAKLGKNIKRGKQISSEFDNILYSEIFNIFAINIDFKNIHHFNFNNLHDLFLNNTRYVDIQIKKSDIYNKIIKYANEEALGNNQKNIKIMKIKQELIINNNDIFSKICNTEIFYANSTDLIIDFLENY